MQCADVQPLPPRFDPGGPPVCPSRPERRPRRPGSRHSQLWNRTAGARVGGLPGGDSRAAGDVRFRHDQTGQGRTMPHQRPGRASGGEPAPVPWFALAGDARHTSTSRRCVASERWDGSAKRPRPALPGHGGRLRAPSARLRRHPRQQRMLPLVCLRSRPPGS